MENTDTPKEQLSDLTDLQRDALDAFITELEGADVDTIVDASYKSGITYGCRSDVADTAGSSIDTVTRTIAENPEVVLWKASESGLTQTTIEELREQLISDTESVTVGAVTDLGYSGRETDARNFSGSRNWRHEQRTLPEERGERNTDRSVAKRVLGGGIVIVGVIYLLRRLVGGLK